MWLLYLIACLPIIFWAVMYYRDRQLVWWEWAGAVAAGFLVAAIFHYLAVFSMVVDTETWSGEVVSGTHYPRWVEEYTEQHSRTYTDSKGHSHTKHWTTTEHRTHPEHWACNDTFNREIEITSDFFEEVRQRFNNLTTETPYKSGFDSGDRHTYVSYNKTGFIYPVTDWRTFENRVKAAPSVFSYVKVPKDIPIFSYPANSNLWQSDRLVGVAKQSMHILLWDQMNSRLGPAHKVNVIAVGFASPDTTLSQYQEAAWIGGKKNDLVITYGGPDPRHPIWARTFGWTEREIVKRNLDTIFLEHAVDDNILPLVEREIRANYQIKDWHKFDYLTVEPPGWSYLVLLIVMAGAQGGLWWWANRNEWGR